MIHGSNHFRALQDVFFLGHQTLGSGKDAGAMLLEPGDVVIDHFPDIVIPPITPQNEMDNRHAKNADEHVCIRSHDKLIGRRVIKSQRFI